MGGGQIVIGNNSVLYSKALMATKGGNIVCGDSFSLNAFSTIYGQGGVQIGNYVMIAGNTTIIPANHGFANPSIPMRKQQQTKEGIIIGNDVWIGSGVRILDGVHVSDGCIIGAGAVLTTSTLPYGIYLGIPAKHVRDRKL